LVAAQVWVKALRYFRAAAHDDNDDDIRIRLP
jgi:hypothetical protein